MFKAFGIRGRTLEEHCDRPNILFGRQKELDMLRKHLDDALSGQGSTLFVSGGAGIGKTVLVEEFMMDVGSTDIQQLSGTAVKEDVSPFQIFRSALGPDGFGIEDRESISFTEIFAINRAGLLIAQSSSKEGELDADIFAGMFSAVQGFVRDSFDSTGAQKAGLGRLEYGDMKILIEHGQHIFLTGIFKGTEHQDMKSALRNALQDIEKDHSEVLENWGGKVSTLTGVQDIIDRLADMRFTVRRDLEGMKLENERLRIADTILNCLLDMSSQKPLLLHLGDLHWADESSLFVLRYLARNIAEAPIFILTTTRPAEMKSVRAMLDETLAEEASSSLELKALDIVAVKQIIGHYFPENDFPGDFPARMQDQCSGNPFFITEVLKQMEADANIILENGKFILASEEISMSGTVEETVMRRLENLKPELLALIEYASCIGQEFDREVIASHNSVSDSLAEVCEGGILGLENDMIFFTHPIFQEVIYSSINERWKSVYHRSLGNFYEERFADNMDDVIFELARHFCRSREFNKAFGYCIKAAEKAEAGFAPEEAVNFYSTSITIMPKLRGMPDAEERRIDILERLGDLRSIIGSYEQALLDLTAVTEATDEPERGARTFRKIAQIHDKMGDYDKKMEVLDKALERLGDVPSNERGRIILARGQMYRRRGNHDEALASFLKAMDSFVDVDKAGQDMGEILLAIGLVHWQRGEYDKALANMQRALAIHEKIGHEYGIAAAYTNMANVYSARGELNKALENYQKGFEIFNKIGEKYTITILLNNIGNNHEDRGELDKALGYHMKALEIRKRIGVKKGMAYSMNNIGNIYRDKGELETALGYFSQSLHILEGMGDRFAEATVLENMGDVMYFMEDYQPSLFHIQKSLEIREEIDDKKGMVSSYCGLSIAYQRMDELDTAGLFAEKALDLSNKIGAKFEESISQRVMSNLNSLLGDYKAALANLAESRHILTSINDKKQLPKVMFDDALILAKLGNITCAKSEFEEALAMFESMGLKLWIEMTEAELSKIEQGL